MERVPAVALRGLSFSIAELILIQAWSEARGLRMIVRLDHGSDTEDYEEVLAFQPAGGRPCQWIMWRDAVSVFIQPLIGRARRYGRVGEALDALSPARNVVLTDVAASRWSDPGLARPSRSSSRGTARTRG
ncbi:MAG TPA: hypothetical protein VGC09_06405 [Rhodopila sp.]